MELSVTLLTEQSEWRTATGYLGLLFECAPDSQLRTFHKDVFAVNQVIGPFEPTKQRAFRLACKLLCGEPEFSGVRQLSVFEEPMIRELTRIFHHLQLDSWLQSNGFLSCRFTEPSLLAGELRHLRSITGGKYAVDSPATPGISLSAKLIDRVKAEGWHLRSVRDLGQCILRRTFPLASKFVAGLGASEYAKAPAGGWWFYTTAYTYTNIGLAYEPYLPRSLHYLVEDQATGGRALKERDRKGHYLYSFAKWADVPKKNDIEHSEAAIRDHLLNIALPPDEATVRNLFLRSAWFDLFATRLLRDGIFQSRVLRRWLDDIRPELLVVGNPAFEGYLLQQARIRKIPTVLLQHGVLGDFCQLLELPADYVLIRGPFFHEFLAPASRRKASIVNYPERRSPVLPNRGQELLFLTTPYSITPYFHENDLDEILGVVVAAAAAACRRLIVRVHPLESVSYYVRRLDRVCRGRGMNPEIEYSQGADLDPVLSRSAVAVLYSSTAFQNCFPAASVNEASR